MTLIKQPCASPCTLSFLEMKNRRRKHLRKNTHVGGKARPKPPQDSPPLPPLEHFHWTNTKAVYIQTFF